MTGRKPVTLYLRWPERDLLALSPLNRLFWGSLIDELITTYDKQDGKNCNPVLLLIDEAGRTAIPSLADHATTVVGRGISLWIAVQSLSQLDVVYGKNRASVMRDNMEIANLLPAIKPADGRLFGTLPGKNLPVRPLADLPGGDTHEPWPYRTTGTPDDRPGNQTAQRRGDYRLSPETSRLQGPPHGLAPLSHLCP